ncbi:phosphatase PAP2 family protein [Paenibacillus sp. GCM10027627]|uniref:phosphatase PAP2 family protein n=1 Tax=unclassified Paenibacillus TaxID=185978 RepID=UPI00362DB47C
MEKMMGWMKVKEQKLLIWANRRTGSSRLHAAIGHWLGTITHMGGATFTLASALLIALLAPEPWKTAGLQSLAAVVISHLPVALIKRKFKRLRPFQAMPGVQTCRNPLQDSSFPSGHTTAIFSWIIPFLLADSMWTAPIAPAALLIAISVAWSRMYLGLHYPTDVAAGALLGTSAAFAVHYFWL